MSSRRKVERRVPIWLDGFPRREVRAAAEQFGLDEHLVLALIKAESNGDPWATRFEPNWTYLYQVRHFAAENRISQPTEEILQKCSWSLMQCMGSVARELGFDGQLTQLTRPEVGLHYGCMKLREFFNKYGNAKDAVASYNAGSVVLTRAGTYRNEIYVDKVFKFYRELTVLA